MLDPHHRLYSDELDVWLRQLARNFDEPLTGRTLPIGVSGDPYIVERTRTLAEDFADRPEFHESSLVDAVARARHIRGRAASSPPFHRDLTACGPTS